MCVGGCMWVSEIQKYVRDNGKKKKMELSMLHIFSFFITTSYCKVLILKIIYSDKGY